MSAILSADDLNDFISPGVACIKPVETLPAAAPQTNSNPYEVTTEDQSNTPTDQAKAAQISLTDCLACSGCVTSAEAVLVSLQSHNEVLNVLEQNAVLSSPNDPHEITPEQTRRKLFVASISLQTRASLAAMLGVSTIDVGHMIDHLLLSEIGKDGRRTFDYVLDTEPILTMCLQLAAQELVSASNGDLKDAVKKPILTSECPGFVCYLEKTHPAVLPHLSKLKSPQALLGTLLKSLLPQVEKDSEVYHVTVMPCFDKKLEASRAELTNVAWDSEASEPIRDVDCVITTRELLLLAEARGVNFSMLPKTPFEKKPLSGLLGNIYASDSPLQNTAKINNTNSLQIGTSGGYLVYILSALQTITPNSHIIEQKGRISDVYEYVLMDNDTGMEIIKMARYYGFRNIQNLIRRLNPPKPRKLPRQVGSRVTGAGGSRKIVSTSGQQHSSPEYAYIEVMACPGGCTNGGGQLKINDKNLLSDKVTEMEIDSVPAEDQSLNAKIASKELLEKVDEAYYSADESENTPVRTHEMDRATAAKFFTESVIRKWSLQMSVPIEKLVYTTYRAVESDVGKPKSVTSTEYTTRQVAELAGKAGGGW